MLVECECVFQMPYAWRFPVLFAYDLNYVEADIFGMFVQTSDIADGSSGDISFFGGCDSGGGGSKLFAFSGFNFYENEGVASAHDEVEFVFFPDAHSLSDDAVSFLSQHFSRHLLPPDSCTQMGWHFFEAQKLLKYFYHWKSHG